MNSWNRRAFVALEASVENRILSEKYIYKTEYCAPTPARPARVTYGM